VARKSSGSGSGRPSIQLYDGEKARGGGVRGAPGFMKGGGTFPSAKKRSDRLRGEPAKYKGGRGIKGLSGKCDSSEVGKRGTGLHSGYSGVLGTDWGPSGRGREVATKIRAGAESDGNPGGRGRAGIFHRKEGKTCTSQVRDKHEGESAGKKRDRAIDRPWERGVRGGNGSGPLKFPQNTAFTRGEGN